MSGMAKARITRSMAELNKWQPRFRKSSSRSSSACRMPQVHHQTHPGLEKKRSSLTEGFKDHYLENKTICGYSWTNRIILWRNLVEEEDGTKGNIGLLCPGFHDPFFSSWLGKSSPSVYCFFSLCGILPEFPFFLWYCPTISVLFPFCGLLRSHWLINWLCHIVKPRPTQKLGMQLIILQNKSLFWHSLPF